MKNIHVLPTDKPSRLVLDTINSTLYLTTTKDFGTKIMQFQNIYITSDEEIKEGDWCLLNSRLVVKYFEPPVKSKSFKKIILTTDQDLIEDGVQAIDDEFLEWFVKNQSCEFVEVIQDRMAPMYHDIIIPKEEHKQETLEEAALDYSGYEEHRMDFIAGAKWQQERMYSDEEVIELLKTFDEKFNSGIVERNKGINNWFEQFKKK